MRHARKFAPLAVVLLSLAACGGDEKKKERKEGLSEEAKAACTGSAVSGAPSLPAGFPKIDEVTYTVQKTAGPTQIVDGYYEGDLQGAHDAFKEGLEQGGFDVLFDEVEERDSEVSWRGKGRSGQVALRKECGEEGRLYVHITNRPA